MISKQFFILSSIFLMILGGIIGVGIFWKQYNTSTTTASSEKENPPGNSSSLHNSLMDNEVYEEPISSEKEKEIQELSARISQDIRAEQRLNLNMSAQLRTYKVLLSQLQDYANRVENNIDLIKQISKDDFKDNVTLQALLFAGKKPEIVARHLEEFDAIRVGAILAKMNTKEASQVFDIWAIAPPIKNGRNFYLDVFSAYLTNRRRDMHPELFEIQQKMDGVLDQNIVQPIAPVNP